MKTRAPQVATGILLVAASALGAFGPATSVLAEPRITEASPQDGDVLKAVPESLHLCFSEPVKVESPDSRFNVLTPDGIALGLRIVFDTSGNCVDVYPGLPEEPPAGTWTFQWLVHSQADDSEGAGVIDFQLGERPPGETTPLQPGDSDSGNSDANASDDGGISTGTLAAIIAGVVLILVAGGGFTYIRWRARP